MNEALPLQRVGSYRLEARLGAGGMGAVYRAFDERLERPVALKQILPETAEDPKTRERFRREARSAARLNHASIVKVHDVLATQDSDWIVMELVEGTTLARLVADGTLTPKRVLPLALEIASALVAAHNEGIVHRDLKSRNVFVTPDGHAKILDFGVSKQIQQEGQSLSALTVEGQLIGTPHAMSPEQALGRKIDPRSDLFSFGSLLYEMLTGTAPFHSPTAVETLNRICTYHPPPVHEIVAGISPELSRLVDRLLEKNPSDRLQNAGETVLALQRLVDTPTVESDVPLEPRALAAGSPETPETVALEATVAEGVLRRRRVSEHRQVTVVCCQAGGADASSELLDPESSYAAIAELEGLARESVERFEGRVTNALGHRVVSCFGYPRAHEDDPRRAVNAALALVARLADRRADATPELTFRVGVHTGPAVVLGSGAGREQLVLGPTLEQAASLERLARPGRVLMSEATRHLTAGTFLVEEIETDPPQGSTQPLRAYQVFEEADTSKQWQTIDKTRTPLVARTRELGMLRDRWRLALRGEGQVVLLSGEAGIGKSRLVSALYESLASDAARWLNAQCSPYASHSPLHPILRTLRGLLRLDRISSASPEGQVERLKEELAKRGMGPDAVPLFAALFGWTLDEESYPPLLFSPEKLRSKTFEAIVELLLQVARQQHTVIFVEDLHWIDPSTRDLLDLLMAELATAPVLVVLTCRPEFISPWSRHAHLTQINLSRLPGDDVGDLIDQLAGGKALPPQVRDHIVAKTDGVPLFVEELTKAILGTGRLVEKEDRYELTAGSIDDLAIPTTLRASLTARLDQLGTAKEVAQLASVVGREFSYKLLSAVVALAEPVLQQEIRRLVEAGLVNRKGFSSRQRYVFKHALIQDAAYDSLLKRERAEIHERVGRVLEERFPLIAKNEPALLAHHFKKGRRPAEAISYLQLAGQQAAESAAYTEALRHQDSALKLLSELPEGPERNQRELELQMARGVSLIAARGYAADGVEEAYSRAQEISDQLNDTSKRFPILYGFWTYALTRGYRDRTTQLAESLLETATQLADPHLTNIAYTTIGQTAFYSGEFDKAHRFLDQSLERSEDEEPMPQHYYRLLSNDPILLAKLYKSWALWFSGYPEQALEWHTGTAEASSNLFDQAMVLAIRASLTQGRQEVEETRLVSERLIQLSTKHGYPLFLAVGTTLHGWARIRQGEVGPGIEEIERGLELYQLTGLMTPYTQHLTYLTEGYLVAGRTEDGLALAETALGFARKNLDAFFESELCRLQGELKLQAGEPAAAESCFREALAVARRQSARLPELRVAVSLGRLLQDQGKEDEARTMVADAYTFFTEGFETADLRKAKALLDELGGSAGIAT